VVYAKQDRQTTKWLRIAIKWSLHLHKFSITKPVLIPTWFSQFNGTAARDFNYKIVEVF